MKTIFFEVPQKEQDFFLKFFNKEETIFFEEKLDETNINKALDAEIISVFVTSIIDKKVIDSLPNLKLITTRSTGFDHIDHIYAKEKGIKVANVAGYGSHTVAEFAFGLILNLSRKISTANEFIKQSPDFNYISSMKGFNLFGKTLGIIGTGKIGKNVVKMANGFGMNIIAYDLYKDENFAKENNFIYKSLDEVLNESDILTLHAPYTKENHHLINKEKVLKMKKGIYLVNTARGELIDTDALIFGLNEKIIAGAGLDVLEGERELKEEVSILASTERTERVKDFKTLLEDRVLMEMPNVIVTPHIAFYSKEAEEEIKKTTIESIQSFINGKTINIIN